MKLRIERIADRGVPNQERLFLTVVEPTNLGSHLVVSSAYMTPTTVANGGKNCFWFPPQEVKAMDQIVLYTRAGNYQPPEIGLVWNTYFYFWGQPSTIWNSLDTCALLFDVASWSASPNDLTLHSLAQLAQNTQPTTNHLAELNRLAGSSPSPPPPSLGNIASALLGHQTKRPQDDDDSNSLFKF